MKKALTILFFLMIQAFHAQFNKTFDINGNTDYLSVNFVIPTSDHGSACVSHGNGSALGYYFIVTKNDIWGNVVFNVRISPILPGSDVFTYVTAMIETEDKGILIGGYYYSPANPAEQPFLVKIDAMGNYQWTRYYRINMGPYIGSQFNKISLARVADDPIESYFLTGSMASDLRSPNDAAIGVVKVDAQGNMQWAKKYYDVALLTGPYAAVRDIPGDIEFSPPSGTYMITGWRQEWTYSAGWQQDRMFFMGIDRNGNVLTQYKSVQVPGYPFWQDMIFDPNTGQFAATYTHGNTGFPGSSVASGIGLITIDPFLTIGLTKSYWINACGENYGSSIALCQNGDYTIGCFEICGPRNPALLKVDNAGLPLFFKRYNIADDVYFGHHCVVPGLTLNYPEEYVLVGEQNHDLRVIRTDIVGNACGAYVDTPHVVNYVPIETLFDYYDVNVGTEIKISPPHNMLPVPFRDCILPGTSYRPGLMTGADANATDNRLVQIYPTLLSIDDAQLMFNNAYSASFSIEVMDISGKVVFTADNLKSGQNKVMLAKDRFKEGIYLVKYHSADGKIVSSKKIIVR